MQPAANFEFPMSKDMRMFIVLLEHSFFFLLHTEISILPNKT